MKKMDPQQLQLQPFQLLDQTWALVVAGVERPNPMTVSWGGFGTLWNKPMVTVYEQHRGALNLCGSRSGRDIDKWEKSKLHPLASETIAVPRVQEAFLSFECRVLAWQDFDPSRFLQKTIEKNYPNQDYHRIYWAEVLAVWSAE